VTLTIDLTPKVDHFMSLPRGLLVPTGIKISYIMFISLATNNNNIHISILPEVVTSEAVAAQVTSLLFAMDQIKKASLKPGVEDCY